MHRWIRVKANMALGAYETFEAEAAIPDRCGRKPRSRNCCGSRSATAWSIALDHPLIKRLRGLA